MLCIKMNFTHNGRVVIRATNDGKDIVCTIGNIANKDKLYKSLEDLILHHDKYDDADIDFESAVNNLGISDIDIDALPGMEIVIGDNKATMYMHKDTIEVYEIDRNDNDKYLINIIIEDIKLLYDELKDKCIDRENSCDINAELEYMLGSVKSGRKIPLRTLIKQIDTVKLTYMSDNTEIRHKTCELVTELSKRKAELEKAQCEV